MPSFRGLIGTLALAVLIVAPLGAQQVAQPAVAQRAQDTASRPPTPRAEDVASVDAIIAALYDVISGGAGQRRDWNRFHSLFHPDARLIPLVRRPGSSGALVLTPQAYVERSAVILERDGFFEKEIARRSERYGNLVHAFSTYESRRSASDSQPFMRGINSIQLLSDGTRWYVMNVTWEAERPDHPIPARYFRSESGE